jgi:hypothetical protein
MIAAQIDYPKIGQSYSVYQAFVAQNKTTDSDPVFLRQPKPKVDYSGSTAVQMGWSYFPCEFEATRSPKALMKYGLRLFASKLDDKPCFRFCSRGHIHINEEMGAGLAARAIPTPHFHRIDSRGILEAYQTPPLADPEECDRIMRDPQRGTNYFCQETNLFSQNGKPILLKIIVSEWFDLSTSDPLRGATFPA